MRIIAGKHRGRTLNEFTIKNKTDLRPTTDRNREALFNLLENSKVVRESGFELRGARILDGFCGTGSVGFEALSRGAAFVTFVDENSKHIDVAKSNAKLLGEIGNCDFLCGDVTKVNIRSLGDAKYDLVFLDPPYKKGLLESALENLNKKDCIKKDTLIVLESSINEKIGLDTWLNNYKEFITLDSRKYGKTIFWFLKKVK